MQIPLKLDSDMQRYFSLHGGSYSGGFLSFDIEDIKIDEGPICRVHILNKCTALMDDFKCKLHPNKPKICLEMDENTINSGKYLLTENCVLKK